MTLEYGITDCDTHCYEPRDAFTRYLPKEYLDRAIAPIRDASGSERILAGNRVATFNSESGLGFDMAYRPGTLKEMLKQMGSGNPEESYRPEPIQPEYLERAPRAKLLVEQGVDRCVLFPAGMALAAEHYVSDTDALYANLHSFNRWYNEEWGFNRDGTIFATALLSLRDLDRAIALTDQILAAGAKFVLLPTGPAYGRGPGDPYFDAIWSRLNEAGVTVTFHIMPFWYFDAVSPAWGLSNDPAAWHMSAWQWMNIYGERPIVDSISSLIFDNVFGRFPNINCLIAEHGASWVPHTLSHMDKSRGMGRNGPWIGGKLDERPSAIFKRRVRVAPYPEDDIPGLVDQLGGDSSCLVMGSDFPHAEGIAEPSEFVKILDPLDEATKRAIMYGNAAALFT